MHNDRNDKSNLVVSVHFKLIEIVCEAKLILPEEPENMSRDRLNPKPFPADFIPGTSSKSIMKKIHKRTTP